MVSVKSELDNLNRSQKKFTKSVSNLTNDLFTSDGFFTRVGSNRHQNQTSALEENRQAVFKSAMTRYKELLEQGESNKKNFLEMREK